MNLFCYQMGFVWRFEAIIKIYLDLIRVRHRQCHRSRKLCSHIGRQFLPPSPCIDLAFGPIDLNAVSFQKARPRRYVWRQQRVVLLPHRQDTSFKKRAKGADFGAKPATARQGSGKAARGTGTECGQDIPVERQAKRTSIDDSPSILNPRSFLLAQAPSLCLRLACQRPCRSLEPSSSGPTWCKKLGFGEPCFAMVKPTNKRILKNTESTVH